MHVAPDGDGVEPLPDGKGARERLTLRRSRDDGRTWDAGELLDAGRSGYAALTPAAGGGFHLLYERGRFRRSLVWPAGIAYRRIPG